MVFEKGKLTILHIILYEVAPVFIFFWAVNNPTGCKTTCISISKHSINSISTYNQCKAPSSRNLYIYILWFLLIFLSNKRKFFCFTDIHELLLNWIRSNFINFQVSDGIQTGQACFTWGTNCCDSNISVKIRNCSGYFVYKLKSTVKCMERYCGNGLPGFWTSFYSPHTKSCSQLLNRKREM